MPLVLEDRGKQKQDDDEQIEDRENANASTGKKPLKESTVGSRVIENASD